MINKLKYPGVKFKVNKNKETHKIPYTEEMMNAMFRGWKQGRYSDIHHNEEENTIEYKYS